MPTFREDTKIGCMVPMMKTYDINDQAITKDKIRDGNVTTEKLADGSVSTDKLPDGAIKTPKIADGNITTSKLAEASVVTSKIADQNVTKEKIADQSVDNSKLSHEAVTYDKLKDKSVITEKINDRAVTTEKVEEKAITNTKLGDQSVDGRVVREASIESKHIGNNAVSTPKIASRSVTNEKIAYNSVSRAELTPDVRNSIDKKADAEQVTNSLYDLEKKIGERFVVEGDVINLPDEEDLTSVKESERDVLKLADRSYAPEKFSGKGYKILRRNIKPVSIAVTKIRVESVPSSDGTLSFTINGKETQVAVSASTDNTTALVAQKVASALQESMAEYEVLVDTSLITLTRKSDGSVTPSAFTASTTGIVCTVTDSTKKEHRNILTPIMMNQPNTIYEIRYDFDLNGETINVPENCTLKFEGGSLSNGTIYANKTNIINSNNSINCVLTGTVNNKIIYSDIVCSLELLNIDFSGKKIIFVKDETIRKPLFLHNVNNCIINGNLHKITNIGCNVVQLDGLFSRIEIFNIIADGQETEHSFLVGNNSSDGIKEYISIHDNYIFNQQVGISLNADLAGDYRFSEIYNNYLENIVGTDPGHGYGIHLANVQFCSIHDNTIKRAMRHSIYHAWGHDNKIYNNKIIEHRYGITHGTPRASLAIFRNSYNLNIYHNEFINCISTNIHIEQSGGSNSDRDKVRYGNQHDIIIEHNKFYYDLNIDYRSIMLGYNILPNYSDLNYEIENVIIKENIFEIKNYIAIENYCCKNLIIDSNHFILSKTAYAISFPSKYLNQYSSNTTVLNNIIECTELDRTNSAIFVSFKDFIQNHTYNIFGNKILNSRVDKHHYFKLLPDNFINNYHTQNNNIQEYRNSKPTEGYYVSGDIIYTYSFKKQLAFVCVESGTPGVWWKVLEGMQNTQYADIESPVNLNIPNGQRFNCGRRMVIGTNAGYVDSIGNSFYFDIAGKLKDAPTTAYNGNSLTNGSTYYAVDIQKPLWWYVNHWVDANGNDISKPTKGTTEQRPSIVDEGFEYYDTTLKKKILWNGTSWVNLDGTQLS